MRINTPCRLLIIALCSLLQSCSMIISSPEQADKNIDQWLAENNYSKIERTFDAINIDRAEYRQLLARKNEVEEKKQHISKARLNRHPSCNRSSNGTKQFHCMKPR